MKGAFAGFKGVLQKTLETLTRRFGVGFLFDIVRTLAAILIALFVAAVVIFFVADDPLFALRIFLVSPFESTDNLASILSRSLPLIFTGLAAAVVLRTRQFNLFGEGAFFIGGLAGAVVAIHFRLPAVLLPVAAIFCAGLLAAVFGTVPAGLKAKLGVNEFVVSLMMNFLLLWVGIYFLANVFNDPRAGDITTHPIPEAALLPYFGETFFTTGILVALAFVVIVAVFFGLTRFGFNMKQTGDNIAFAEYSGIKPSRPVFYSQVIGAGIAGIGGATHVLSHYRRFNWTALPMHGFDGFMIAIIAKNNPFGVLLVALFFGYIRTGALQMEIFTRMSSEIVTIIQAVVILLVAAQAFLVSLRKRLMLQKVERLKRHEQKAGV